jgi:hypothetical protein
MRKSTSGFVKVRAVSGTHVVFLAFDMVESDAKGLMGFAIQRIDLTEDETIWLRGNKTFRSIRPPTGFEDASSHEHPFQAFQWLTTQPNLVSLPLCGYSYVWPAGSLDRKACHAVTIGPNR